jgi:hypothetical protein
MQSEPAETTDMGKNQWRLGIKRYLIEIMTIFIGITLSFAFEEWRDGKKENRATIDLLQGLDLDLVGKTEEVTNDYKANKNCMLYIDSVLDLSTTKQKIPTRLIKKLYRTVNIDHWFFETTTPSFNIATSQGAWQQLPDSLRRQIYQVYYAEFGSSEKYIRKEVEFAGYCTIHYWLPRKIIYRRGNIIADNIDNNFIEAPNNKAVEEALNDPEFVASLLLLRNHYFATAKQLDHTKEMLERLTKNIQLVKFQLE